MTSISSRSTRKSASPMWKIVWVVCWLSALPPVGLYLCWKYLKEVDQERKALELMRQAIRLEKLAETALLPDPLGEPAPESRLDDVKARKRLI